VANQHNITPPAANRSDAVPGGRSEFQLSSQTYYEQMRESHDRIFSSRTRMEEEQRKKRYSDVVPPELEPAIRNLGTFIQMLHDLCGPGPDVCGVDYGCGSHWFVDFVRTDPAYLWNAVGYDPDQHAIDLARQPYPQSELENWRKSGRG